MDMSIDVKLSAHSLIDRVVARDNRPREAAKDLVGSWLAGPDGTPEPVHESWGLEMAADVARLRDEMGLPPAPRLASWIVSRTAAR
jgi:hypothetical protein